MSADFINSMEVCSERSWGTLCCDVPQLALQTQFHLNVLCLKAVIAELLLRIIYTDQITCLLRLKKQYKKQLCIKLYYRGSPCFTMQFCSYDSGVTQDLV